MDCYQVCSILPLLQLVIVSHLYELNFWWLHASPPPLSDAVEQEEPAEEPAEQPAVEPAEEPTEEPKDEKATTTPPSSPIRAEEGRLS